MKSVWVLGIGRHERTIHQLEVANSNTFYGIIVIFFMAKRKIIKINLYDFLGKKCEPSFRKIYWEQRVKVQIC